MSDYRSITVKLFEPGNRKFTKKTFRPGPRRLYTEKDVEGIIETLTERIEAAHPMHEYRLVEIGPGEFNFVWDHEREAAAAALRV